MKYSLVVKLWDILSSIEDETKDETMEVQLLLFTLVQEQLLNKVSRLRSKFEASKGVDDDIV